MNKRNTHLDYQCSICGLTQELLPIASIAEKYVVSKCCSCKVASVYPLPSTEELVNYYSSYHMTQENEYRNSELVAMHRGIVDYLLSKMGSKKELSFLDFGFGSGAFIKQVAEKGFTALGVEFSKQNCEQLEKYCREKNLNIYVMDSLTTSLEKLPNKQIDCITLFQVIEHVLNPLELISSLSSLQSSGGILYMECPNNDALYLKIKNAIRKQAGREAFWDSLNPPQHLYGFNRQSMSTLLKKAGYTPIEINDYFMADGLHAVENMSWYPSFKEMVSNKKLWNFYQLSKLLIRLLDPLASKLMGAGSGLYALAYKK